METLIGKWTSSAACEGSLEACIDDDLDAIQEGQGVKRLPRMYRAFMLCMGRNTGGLEAYLRSEITYPAACEFKKRTFDLLRQSDIFVLARMADGEGVFYVHVSEDDPVVYWIGYDQGADFGEARLLETKSCGALSQWLTDIVGDAIEEYQLPR